MADPMLNRRHSSEVENSDSSSPESLITNHIDIWTTAIERKSSAGRGTSNKFSLYGIKKLRELILELAVRGKLVPQDVNDEPASILLERIAAEKAQLVKDGKLKKQKPLPEISEDEKPFELPNGWAWARLGEYAEVKGGKRLPKGHTLISDQTEYAYIRVTDMKDGSVNLHGLQYLTADTQKLIQQYTISKNDLYITIAGTIGEVGSIPEELDGMNLTENAAKIIFNQIDRLWLKKSLSANFSMSQFIEKVNQLAQPKLALHRILSSILPVPPLEEQHRIVAKVDELMSLCDALEAQTEASIAAHQTLVETLLNALLLPNTTQPADSQSASLEPSFADSLETALNDSFIDSWQRVAEHFDTLFTTAASIDTLKQTILQLAVMGKLVEQDPNDELVEELIEKIYTEHCARQLSTKEKIVVDHEYEIAKKSITKNVALIKARFICGFITKGTTPSKPELLEAGEVPFLKVYNIVRNKLDFAYKPIFISAETNEGKLKRSRVFPNDVIMNIVGPPLGKVAVITDEYPEWNMNQALAVFRPLAGIDSQYLYYMLPTDTVLASVLKEVKGTAGQDNLSLEQCRDLLIPVPSIKQQRKIVKLIEELMALCDQLKARLSDAQTTQLHLTDAIVEQAI
jgi:type I restriction enzyme S subunit